MIFPVIDRFIELIGMFSKRINTRRHACAGDSAKIKNRLGLENLAKGPKPHAPPL